MAHIGNVTEYQPDKERLHAYLERLDGYFDSNKIGLVNDAEDAAAIAAADKEKVNGMIAIIGPTAYGILQNQCKPDKPNTKNYAQLVALLQGH